MLEVEVGASAAGCKSMRNPITVGVSFFLVHLAGNLGERCLRKGDGAKGLFLSNRGSMT